MQSYQTLCEDLKQINLLVEAFLTNHPTALLEIKSLLADATYKASRMDRKLWEYKLKVGKP